MQLVGYARSATSILFDPSLRDNEVGERIFWKDLQFPTSAGKVPAANNPTWAALTTNTGEYGFGVDEFIDLASQELPHWWKEGTAGNFHIHFSVPDANATGASRYAQFTLYIALKDPDTNAWVETSLTAEREIPDGTLDLESFYLDLGDTDLTGLTIGSQVKLRIKRIAATGGTEYASDVFIHQIGCHLQANSLGSRQEGVK